MMSSLFVANLPAFVYDIEPTNPASEYMLEKELFDRQNDCWFREFPSFDQWCDERERASERFWDGIREMMARDNPKGGDASLSSVNWALECRSLDPRCATLEPQGELNSRD